MPRSCPSLLRRFLPSLLALVLAACAGPGGGPDEAGETPSSSRPVISLLAKADARSENGEWEQAAALLERALRIEPRNAWLWHRLAEVRLRQGRYAQAVSLARKSGSLAPGDAALQERNRRLIEEARTAGGG